MTDPFDSELNDSGLDPTPAYRSQLESKLADAYDGVVPSARSQTMRRGVVIGAAAAVVAAAIVGVIALSQTSGRKTIVDTPPTDLDTTPASATTLVPTTITEPATTVVAPTSSAPPQVSSSFPTTLPPPTTAVPDFTGVTTIDLGQPAPPLQPTTIASYPQTPPGDLFGTSAAAVAPGNRVAVLDLATGELRFLDATTGAELSRFTVMMPTMPQSAYLSRLTFVGPDDVLYLADLGSGGNTNESAFVAYAPNGDSYVEVARVPFGFGDAPISLAPTGIAFGGDPAHPIMPFVGLDGQASGATLDIDQITRGCAPGDIFTFERQGRSWEITYVQHPDVEPLRDACVQLDAPEFAAGPTGTVVVSYWVPKPDGDVQQRFTILGDDITSYDSDWQYIGATSDALVFAHSDQDSIDIGTVTI